MTPSQLILDGDCDAVLFDLDGTLVDTARDMVAVLQAMQVARGLEPIPYESARRQVSNGAIGLLRAGFPELAVEFGDRYHAEYLERYTGSICIESRLFDGLAALLERLESAGRPWGIVTNKPEYLTNLLLDELELAARSACTVGGDSLPVRKPHPDPLLHACDIAGVAPHRSVYVGDAARDIEAGLAAGMATVAAAYGYITEDDDPASWGADAMAADVEELTQIVLKAVNLY
ncbi:MAG: HAD-IA family hydrolase [Gammaproteobacteria bacterium]|nr:HAD-IA family hydrolase [Gammaproteobacteria bacterium]MBT8105187.1 HAD-IA family hydrolase [Gammaproteobacteria bacterium]NNF50053.1 HAD-IA family hydrolase [Woeseiaceae bacterium]NNK25201.1 HAD-IA family hydrolase [Woeseiaceae bacterium]